MTTERGGARGMDRGTASPSNQWTAGFIPLTRNTLLQGATYSRSIESWTVPQVSSRCQQPGPGMSTREGPGPPGTVVVIVIPSPSRVPAITMSPEPPAALDTQRILLAWSFASGLLRGAPNRMATRCPLLLVTNGMDGSASEKPPRAQVGSTAVVTGVHADGTVVGCSVLPPRAPTTAATTTITASAAATGAAATATRQRDLRLTVRARS